MTCGSRTNPSSSPAARHRRRHRPPAGRRGAQFVNDIMRPGERSCAIRRGGGQLLRRRHQPTSRRWSWLTPRQARRDGQQRRWTHRNRPRWSERGGRPSMRQHEEHLPVDHPRVPASGQRVASSSTSPPPPACARPASPGTTAPRARDHHQVAGPDSGRQHPRQLHQPRVQPGHRPVRQFAGGPVTRPRAIPGHHPLALLHRPRRRQRGFVPGQRRAAFISGVSSRWMAPAASRGSPRPRSELTWGNWIPVGRPPQCCHG